MWKRFLPAGRACRSAFFIFVFLVVCAGFTPARAATPPMPGEYTGAWMGRPDPGDGRQGGEARVLISTNGEVIVLLIVNNPITGSSYTRRLDGTVRRNGVIREISFGWLRAVSQQNGSSLRGSCNVPVHNGPPRRIRFYAHHD